MKTIKIKKGHILQRDGEINGKVYEVVDGLLRSYTHAVKIVVKHGGETIAVTENPPIIEGELPKGRLVVLKFPTLKDGENFYNDPEYQPLKKARKMISQSDSTLFENGF
ncbi:MAG: DUF1330 domain-containing protein [Flavobacteriales bacterium]